MKTIILTALAAIGLAVSAAPSAAASNCAAIAGKAYTFELTGATKPGAAPAVRYAWIGRLVMGSAGKGTANSFLHIESPASAAFRSDAVTCTDVPGLPPKLAFSGAGAPELRFLVKGTADNLALMRDDSFEAVTGDARRAPLSATVRYSACTAANGNFAGTSAGPRGASGGIATLAQYKFVAGTGPVSWLSELASSSVSVQNARVKCTVANAAGAGRFTFLNAAGAPVGSAIVYSSGLTGTGFAIIEEKLVGTPAAGWLDKQF